MQEKARKTRLAIRWFRNDKWFNSEPPFAALGCRATPPWTVPFKINCLRKPVTQPFGSPNKRQNLSGERKTFAQINAPHLYIVPQFVRSAGTKYTPFRDNVRAVRHAEGLTNVVVGD